MPTETERLIGLLEATVQALIASQQQQSAMFAQMRMPVPEAAPQVPVVVTGRTLNEWLDIHWQNLLTRGYKPSTLKNRSAVLAHVRRVWGERPVHAIRPHEISSGLQQFLPARASTGRRVWAELREAMNDAVANDWAQSNPVTHVRAPVERVKRKRLKFETWQAMLTLAKAGPQRWLPCLLLLALATGQRRADLGKMRFDDVVDGYLRIEQQKEAGKGYGARVELPLTLRLNAIGMTLGEVIEMCRSAGKPGPTLLRTAGGKAIELSSLSARFSEGIRTVLGEDAHGEHEWPSLHEVRSLAARLYRAEGHDVQTLLGHKAAEMTEMYVNDRGLSSREWKRLVIPETQSTTALS